MMTATIERIPFWDSPAFTTVMVIFIGTLASLIQFWIKGRTDAKVQLIANDTAKVVNKVDVIEKHTNGMLTALQSKVDSQEKDRVTTAIATEKDIQIALLKKPDK